MRIRRCGIVLFEPREQVAFELDRLIAGGTGIEARVEWFALAPHLDAPVAIEPHDVAVLGALERGAWTGRAAFARRHGRARVDALIASGLIVTDAARGRATRRRDDALRRAHWYPAAAVLHQLGRWDDVVAGREADRAGLRNMIDLAGALGAPPPATVDRGASARRIALPRLRATALDELLRARATCRNFAPRELPRAALVRVLQRVFAAQASVEIVPGTTVLKKNTPSGGGLHPIEAYLLVQRVAGVAPGLYHYHPVAHALEPLRAPAAAALARLGERFVAGQDYFSDAPVLVVLSVRFARKFWKYRNHPKAYRSLAIEAGHLSQLLYMTATELGLGAFVTSAINERAIERALGLDPCAESPLAVCGFGPRAKKKKTVEFDPLRAVWPSG